MKNIIEDYKKVKSGESISLEEKIEISKKLTLFKKYYNSLPKILQNLSIIEEKLNKIDKEESC